MWGVSPWGTVPWGASPSSGGVEVHLTDSAEATTTVDPLLTAMLFSSSHAATVIAPKIAYHLALSSSSHASTAMVVSWSLLLTSTATATAHAPLVGIATQIVETLLATGECTSVMGAKNALVASVFAIDALNRAFPVSISDSIALTEEWQSTMVTTILLVDQALAHTTLGSLLNVTIVVRDEIEVTDLLSHLLRAHENIHDTVVCSLSFQLDGDVYAAVVLNTESKAITEYQDFPFNSFAPFGNTHIGCADDGIYELTGTTDNGSDIAWSLRTGLMQLANGKKARCPEAFLGYTADGNIYLKVITTHPNGTKEENWYKAERRTAQANRSTRVKIGRGLSSVYWSFELLGTKPAAIDTVRLFPMTLDRLI